MKLGIEVVRHGDRHPNQSPAKAMTGGEEATKGDSIEMLGHHAMIASMDQMVEERPGEIERRTIGIRIDRHHHRLDTEMVRPAAGKILSDLEDRRHRVNEVEVDATALIMG